MFSSTYSPSSPGGARIRGMERPHVPASIQAPPDEELVFVARAEGVQIYVCRSDGDGQPAWALKAPDASLYDERGNVVGKHFVGPTWKHNDGSEISAKLIAKVDAPDPGSISWLLLSVNSHSGQGVFSSVTTIQRIHTSGGLAPGAGCGEATREAEFRSHYSADYFFYARAK
jgi:uncharacterized protein DUF3455